MPRLEVSGQVRLCLGGVLGRLGEGVGQVLIVSVTYWCCCRVHNRAGAEAVREVLVLVLVGFCQGLGWWAGEGSLLPSGC